jgi:hypothetical protein
MSSQREHSLDSFLNETRELKERMKQTLPSHIALLRELSSLPQELERRFWASRVEALVETVQKNYESLQAKAQKVDFLGKFMTVGIDVVLRAGGMQPIAPPPSPQLGVTICSSGRIEPDWLNNPNREPGAVFVTYEQFMATIEKLKEKLLNGTIEPNGEGDIPRLVYSLALKSAKTLPES